MNSLATHFSYYQADIHTSIYAPSFIWWTLATDCFSQLQMKLYDFGGRFNDDTLSFAVCRPVKLSVSPSELGICCKCVCDLVKISSLMPINRLFYGSNIFSYSQSLCAFCVSPFYVYFVFGSWQMKRKLAWQFTNGWACPQITLLRRTVTLPKSNHCLTALKLTLYGWQAAKGCFVMEIYQSHYLSINLVKNLCSL